MKYLLVSLIAIIFSLHAYSQSSFIVSYPISFPMGDLHSYIGKTSFRGINFEWVKTAKPGVAVGIETGWNVFYERTDNKDYTKGTQTISGVQFRYTNAVPILLQTKFYPTTDKKKINTYVGIGVGTLYVNRSTDFGLYRITTDAWSFCLRPEGGFLFNLQPGVKAMAGVKWYPAFNTADLDGQSFVSANFGFVFTNF